MTALDPTLTVATRWKALVKVMVIVKDNFHQNDSPELRTASTCVALKTHSIQQNRPFAIIKERRF